MKSNRKKRNSFFGQQAPTEKVHRAAANAASFFWRRGYAPPERCFAFTAAPYPYRLYPAPWINQDWNLTTFKIEAVVNPMDYHYNGNSKNNEAEPDILCPGQMIRL
jgi:hypothetical protein